MARHRTAFSEYPTGAPPSDFTYVAAGSLSSWNVTEDATALEGKYVNIVVGNGRDRVWLWNTPVYGTDEEACVVRARIGGSFGAAVRSTNTIDGYLAIMNTGNGFFRLRRAGVQVAEVSVAALTAPFMVEVKANRLTGLVEARVWSQSGERPATPQISYTDAAPITTGQAAWYYYGTGQIDEIGVGTAGEAAPYTGEPAAPTTTHLASQFRVRRVSDDAILFDSGEVAASTQHTATWADLGVETQAYGEIRYKDENGWSAWGTAAFTIPASNVAPNVTITAPADGHSVVESTTVEFVATATDPEDGDLSASIQWTSSRDGAIGTGPTLNTAVLSVGVHDITASVVDSGGLPGSDAITITITANQRPAAPTVTVAGIARDGAEVSASAFSDPEGDPLTDSELRIRRASDSAIVYGPVSLGVARTFPHLVSGLAPAVEYVAEVRDSDSRGFGSWGGLAFTTLANSAPTAPVITAPAAGAWTNILELVALDATGSTDADGDPIVYGWQYRIGAGAPVLIIEDLAAPAYSWDASALPLGDVEIRPFASDPFVTTYGAWQSITLGAGTESFFEDFSGYTRDGVLAVANGWTPASLGVSITPEAPRAATVLRTPSAHGGLAVEYNGTIQSTHTTTYARQRVGHWWTGLEPMLRPCVATRFRLRHTDLEGPFVLGGSGYRGFAGAFLAMGGDPLSPTGATGYAVYLSQHQAKGNAYQPDGAIATLHVDSNSIPYLHSDRWYVAKFSHLGAAVENYTTVKKSYLDYIAGLGPYDGFFATVPRTVVRIKVEVFDGDGAVLLGSAILGHYPSGHSETVFADLVNLSGHVGPCVTDYPGSVQYDWFAARSLESPEIPTERVETTERWTHPVFGFNAATAPFTPSWLAIKDPQGRTPTYRLERYNGEADVPAWELLEEGLFAPVAGVCSGTAIVPTSWRQSRGWRLRVSHSFDGTTWSDPVTTERFIVDRSGGTFHTGFSEYAKGSAPSGWVPVWSGHDSYVEVESGEGSLDNAILHHQDRTGIFGMYTLKGHGWSAAGARRHAAAWATQRINGIQAWLGLMLRADPLNVQNRYYGYIEAGKMAVQATKTGGRTSSLPFTLIYGAPYNLLLEMEDTAGLPTMRFKVWRTEVDDEPAAPQIEFVIGTSYLQSSFAGLAGTVTSANPIHGGARMRETENFTTTFLFPLPEDRPAEPGYEPNAPPPIETFCPASAGVVVPVYAEDHPAKPANWCAYPGRVINIPVI